MVNLNQNMDPHWSHQVSEVTLSFSPDNDPDLCPLSIAGGSEYGHFCLIGDGIKHNKIIYHTGQNNKLQSKDVILEVQGQKVAGYTSHDLRDWVTTAGQNSNPVLIKTAKAGTLDKELRPYLNFGFPKGSVDHDTQMTIRENLFQRTVPCTTRPARDGEVNGVDYTFVSEQEFRDLERSGNLLESGDFDGNLYGMPKPPILKIKDGKKNTDIKPGAHPSSKGKRQRNRSTIEATSNKNHPIDNTVHSAHIPGTDMLISTPARASSRGPSDRSRHQSGTDRSYHDSPRKQQPQQPPPSQKPPVSPTGRPPVPPPAPDPPVAEEDLPPNWELAHTPEGHFYYIDPKYGSHSLSDPRSGMVLGRGPVNPHPKAPAPEKPPRLNPSPIPQFHNTETTHWIHPSQKDTISPKNPTPQLSPLPDLPYGWEKVDDPQYGTYYIDHLNKKTQYDPPLKSPDSNSGGADPGLISPSPSAKSSKSVPSQRDIDSVSQQHAKAFFTKDPSELSGEKLSTTLTKSPRGFGFTIVGGDERDEEFLQIKNVVPNGPADHNGVLRTGDVLVRVNGELVLGFTHSDVVSMFQTIKPGEHVSLEVCRGYPLAFDPNDPNTEIVTTVAVSMPKLTPAEAKQREAQRAAMDDDNSSLDDFADSLLTDLTLNNGTPNGGNQPTVLPPKGQMFSIEITRGASGFGFTIADSVHGQKVKHILDQGRCKTLQEGDILVRIAGKEVRDMDHLLVVDVLKSCLIGHPTEIVVQRGGLKKVPRPPSQNRSNEDSNEPHSPLSSPEFGRREQHMKFIMGSDSTGSGDEHGVVSLPPLHPSVNNVPVLHRPTASSNRPGMFKWTVNGSTSQLQRPNLHSTSSFGNKDDDSEGHITPPPLPSKGRLHSDTTNDSKENLLSGLASSSLTEAPSSMMLPSQLRDSTNIITNRDDMARQQPSASLSLQELPPHSKQQSISQHPVMNQYTSQYYQPQKESFYDVPSKYRSDSGLTAQQRFDMMGRSDLPRGRHEFGLPLDAGNRSHPQVLPPSNHQPDSRRSRTPGPEHMRAPPDRSTDDRFRSKTPNPTDHRSRAHALQNNLNQPPTSLQHTAASLQHTAASLQHTGATSFENSAPQPSHSIHPAHLHPNQPLPPGWREQWTNINIILKRAESGFGFRIVGGPEEGTQVAIGYIVPSGAADVDHRLQTGDEIIRVDNNHTLGESHHKVVALMGQASSNGQVNLGVRRRLVVPDTSPGSAPPQQFNSPPPAIENQPFECLVTRQEHEGFGFIIVSSVNKVGAVVGRIIEQSPAERCGKLRVGDRILAVNVVDISRMLHEDIVTLIKDSGYSVKLLVSPVNPSPNSPDKRPNTYSDFHNYPILNRSDPLRGSMMSATALPTMSENETLVRNMHSHTALSTADRYNDTPGPTPLTNSKSAGNLAPSQPNQSYGNRPDSRYPSTSSSNLPPTQPGGYQPPARPRSAYEPQRPSYEPPRSTYEPPRSNYEPQRPGGYDPAKVGVRMPMSSPAIRPTANTKPSPSNSNSSQGQPQSPGSISSVELLRGSRGFGFSIRGGREFNNMPLYVLRIAEDGAASQALSDQRLLVGDEILEINDQVTTGMSHSDAINLIQSGGSKVKLLIRRTGQLPNIGSDRGIPSPQGSGMSSPAIRNQPAATTAAPTTNTTSQSQYSSGYDPHQNSYLNKERYGLPSRPDTQDNVDNNKYPPQPSNSYNPPPPANYRSDPPPRYTNARDSQAPAYTRPPADPYRPQPPDMSRQTGYQSDRYGPTPGRYQEQSQRGYPVGRDSMSSNAYPSQTNVQRPNLSSGQHPPKPPHYNTQPPNSSYPSTQNNGPSHNSHNNGTSYPSSQSAAPSYSNNKSNNYTQNYQQHPPDGQGSYNAGAMNRQLNQNMYNSNYYDRNANQPSERQPPIGQNNFDSRAPPANNYPSSYNSPRLNGPQVYKPMDYGPQGMVRGGAPSNPQQMYSNGQSRGPPGYNQQQGRHNSSNNQQPQNSYYSRQPAYQ